jgi:proline dehydrogenase
MHMDTPRTKLDFSNTEVAFRYKTDKELKKTAWMYSLMNKAWLVNMGSKLAIPTIKMGFPFAETLVKNTIFEQFVGGTTLLNSLPAIERLAQYNVQTILDYGVERKSDEEDLNKTMTENIRGLEFAGKNASVPVVGTKITGLARFALLEKIHRGDSLTKEEEEEYQRVIKRMDSLCHVAAENNVGIYFDAEESWIQKPLDDLVDTMMERYNKEKIVVANTFQLYLKDRLGEMIKSHEKALEKGYKLGAKLVRGAYMEKERLQAQEMGYDDPIQPDKAASDKAYDDAIRYCLKHYETILLCNATHNQQSCELMAELIDQKGLPRNHPHFVFSQLYGMSDHLTFNLAEGGFNSAKYVPYGRVKDVIPYLLRRAQENSSVTGDMTREHEILKKEVDRRGL